MASAPERSVTTKLEGSIVELEPLAAEHADELREAARAPEIWRWLAHVGESREYFDRWMELSLEAAATGEEGPFAIRLRSSGKLIGSSRYLNVRRPDRALEIGWTWFEPTTWGSGANVETKLLMLRHAFESLGCLRVEFKTDARNRRSRAALAALPAQFEGILRKHMTVPDVGVRDSAYFSIVDDEWPAVRANLEARLAAKLGTAAERRPRPRPSTRYADSADELDAIEPLWNALQEHHAQITPDLGGATPKREASDAWRLRRAKYERWLGDPATFLVIAEDGGEPVGYAFVTVGPGYASWATGERLAELETLSVLPQRRGEGVGVALLDAVWDRLAESGVDALAITTTVTNVDAQRFYERQGFQRGFVVYYGRRNAR